MNKSICLFEFDFLVSQTSLNDEQTLDSNVQRISDAAFQYLKQLCLLGGKESRLLKLRSIKRHEVLQVQNYAGVIFTPDKTQIEVLPKVGRQVGDIILARQSLLMMLKALKGFRHIETKMRILPAKKCHCWKCLLASFYNLSILS